MTDGGSTDRGSETPASRASETLAAEPLAPEPLARRVAELLDDVPNAGDDVGRHLAAAERAVERLLREQSTSRASALDLLAADALATYAFELAAERPDAIPALAERAMAGFAALTAAAPEPRA